MTKSTRYAKRHYEDVARILQKEFKLYADHGMVDNVITPHSRIRDQFVELFTLDNDRFDAVRFKRACIGLDK